MNCLTVVAIFFVQPSAGLLDPWQCCPEKTVTGPDVRGNGVYHLAESGRGGRNQHCRDGCLYHKEGSRYAYDDRRLYCFGPSSHVVARCSAADGNGKKSAKSNDGDYKHNWQIF